MNKEELKLLSDDEKIEILKNETDSEDIKNIILTIKNDEKKIEAMKLYLKDDSSYYIEIIESLSSVDNMFKCLDMLESWDLCTLFFDIMNSISEEEMIRGVSLIQDDFDRACVISDLPYDELKIKLLETVKLERNKSNVICSLYSEEKRIELLEILNEEFNKAIVISSLNDDEKKLELLKIFRDEDYKTIAITSLKSEIVKLEQLNYLKKEENRAKVIASLHYDLVKIKQLETIKEEINKVNIIVSLQSDELKIEQLRRLKDERYIKRIIFSIEDTQSKIEQLELLHDEMDKADVISSLINADKIKIEQLQKLDNEYAKAIVIGSIYNEDEKIEQVEKLNDDIAKAMVIGNLYDAEIIKEQAKKIDNEYVKVLLEGVAEIRGFYVPTENMQTSRENLKKHFLEDKRKYTQIGLDKRITIGMEIETEGFLSKIIGSLHKIATTKEGLETRGWEAKGDASLEHGIEIVSPILTDNKEDIEDIYTICSMLQKLGQQTNERCGGHIHIGADYLKSKEAYVNLFEIWGNAEKIIYKMCNEKGTIPRMNMQKYAPPISPKLNEAIEKGTINIESEEDLESFISDVKAVQEENRFFGLNMLNINNGKNTIEFRVPNGTINPDTWLENARLFGRIVQISQMLTEIENKPEKTQEDKKLLELKQLLKQDMPEQEKMEVLIELLFTEDEREVYRERYISSTKILEQIPDEENPFQQTTFSSVDFKKKKHSLDEFYDVAVNERSGTTNEVIRETTKGIRKVEKKEKFNENNYGVHQ